MRTSSIPACFSRAPTHRPEKPPPINATVTSSNRGSRSTTCVYGSSSIQRKRPVGSRYWSLPSGRRRLSRSSRYLTRSSSWSTVTGEKVAGEVRWGASPHIAGHTAVGELVTIAGCSVYATGGEGPCVVVLHEWWGLVPHIEDVCDRFAAAGFAAFAPDLYDGAVAPEDEPDRAEWLMAKLDRGRAIAAVADLVTE